MRATQNGELMLAQPPRPSKDPVESKPSRLSRTALRRLTQFPNSDHTQLHRSTLRALAAHTGSCQDGQRRSRGSRKASAGAHGIGGALRPVSKPRWLVHALAPKPSSASFKPSWPRSRGVRRSRRGLLRRCPLLDLEIIVQGEADEEEENDRNNVLEGHQPLIAFWRYGVAFSKAWAK
jgi:hypothetical protein